MPDALYSNSFSSILGSTLYAAFSCTPCTKFLPQVKAFRVQILMAENGVGARHCREMVLVRNTASHRSLLYCELISRRNYLAYNNGQGDTPGVGPAKNVAFCQNNRPF